MTPVQLDTPDRAQLARDADWWRLYDQTFPATSREPAEVILRSLDADVGVALRARAADQTIGLATLHVLRDPPAVFLVYLAIDPAHRSTGVGGQLFERAWQEGVARSRRPPTTMIWEVEAPSPEHANACNRRLNFFQRHGGQVLPSAYVQPPVDGVNPVPMLLMCRPAPGIAMPTPSETERLVRALYFEKYGAINRIPTPVLESLL
jgi:GNAT superfamily N-acetyltransferase